MFRWLTARTGHLAKWPCLIPANYRLTPSPRPSLQISSRFHSSQPIETCREVTARSEISRKEISSKPSWSAWLHRHRTSLDEIQTVYDACAQSRVFAPTAERLVTGVEVNTPFRISRKLRPGDMNHLRFTFKSTQGLQPQDWKARGIEFAHAMEIARQLHLKRYFSGKKLSDLRKNWTQIVAQALVDAAKSEAAGPGEANGLESMAETVAEERIEPVKASMTKVTTAEGLGDSTWSDTNHTARQASRNSSAANQAYQVPKEGGDVEKVETAQADRARRSLKQRKKAEQESDAAEGIRSVRRPLRLAATFKGVPLTFDTMRSLKRLERGGREIIVDKEVKKRTKGTRSGKAQQKREQPRPASDTKDIAIFDRVHKVAWRNDKWASKMVELAQASSHKDRGDNARLATKKEKKKGNDRSVKLRKAREARMAKRKRLEGETL